MEDILDLYAEPYQPAFPVICFDEVPYQMVSETRLPFMKLFRRSVSSPRRRSVSIQKLSGVGVWRRFAPPNTHNLQILGVETVKVHDFIPRRYKVVQELLLGVSTCVDLRQGPELGVRTEDQVDTCAGPLECARCAITTLEYVIVFRGCLPRRAHVEQIHEEVIGERFWPLGEDAVFGLSEVGIQGAHAAKENRHLGGG